MATKHLNKLLGQRVVCIGGTKGIGFGIAEACVELGATVVVASSKQENIDKAVKKLQGSYPDASNRVSGHIVDLAIEPEDSLKKLFESATGQGSNKIDHIVDTSGDAPPTLTLDSVTAEDLRGFDRVRYHGAILVAKIGKEYLNPTYNSSITMTSGVLGYKPPKGMGLITGVGGAKEGLTRGLAIELAPIRVNLVNPGFIHTELMESHAKHAGEVDAVLQQYASRTLLDRIGTVEDMAEIYLGIMKCGYMTGSVVHAEGGYLLKT